MIAVSVGFGIFPMHLYSVVRAGVDPLVAKITYVVPIAETGEGLGVRSEATTPVQLLDTPLVANNSSPLTPHPSRRSE
jgi:NADH-quinone oxidoreductase subunit M